MKGPTMKYVYFMKAGNYHRSLREAKHKVFFTSHNRQQSQSETVFHHNDFSTYWRIPRPFFKDNFQYETLTGIYRTDLTYLEINQFTEVWDHVNHKVHAFSVL